MSYTIDEHKHRLSAWAAGRAASVKGCRFTVEQAKLIIETANLKRLLSGVDVLPSQDHLDLAHCEWRQSVIKAAEQHDLAFTHGVAAKLINVYLKAGIVCGGHHNDERVKALHPPIDSVLLDELYNRNIGNLKKAWRDARSIRWSNFNSDQYETIISNIRLAIGSNALWEVEQFWQGYQGK